MKNDYLIERKENFFTKVANFIRNLFKKNGSEEDTTSGAITSDTQNNDFMDYIKVEKDSNEKLLNLQKSFEIGEVLIDELSDNELVLLKDLYNSQKVELDKQIDEKKTKIGMLRFRLTGSVNKI